MLIQYVMDHCQNKPEQIETKFLSTCFVFQCLFAYAQFSVGKVNNLETRGQNPFGESRGDMRLPKPPSTVSLNQFLCELVWVLEL